MCKTVACNTLCECKDVLYLLFLAGIISLLDEPEDDAKVFALQKLNGLVDNFWAEISEIINKM